MWVQRKWLPRQELSGLAPACSGRVGRDLVHDRIEGRPGSGVVDEMVQRRCQRGANGPGAPGESIGKVPRTAPAGRPIRPPRQSMMSTCVFRCSIGGARPRSFAAKVETARKPMSASFTATSGPMRFQGGTYQWPASGPNSSISRRLATVHSDTIASRPRSIGVSAFRPPGSAWLRCRTPCIATHTSGSSRRRSAGAGSTSRGMTASRQGPHGRGAATAGHRAPGSARRRRRPAARAAPCDRQRSSDPAPSTG